MTPTQHARADVIRLAEDAQAGDSIAEPVNPGDVYAIGVHTTVSLMLAGNGPTTWLKFKFDTDLDHVGTEYETNDNPFHENVTVEVFEEEAAVLAARLVDGGIAAITRIADLRRDA